MTFKIISIINQYIIIFQVSSLSYAQDVSDSLYNEIVVGMLSGILQQ